MQADKFTQKHLLKELNICIEIWDADFHRAFVFLFPTVLYLSDDLSVSKSDLENHYSPYPSLNKLTQLM